VVPEPGVSGRWAAKVLTGIEVAVAALVAALVAVLVAAHVVVIVLPSDASRDSAGAVLLMLYVPDHGVLDIGAVHKHIAIHDGIDVTT